MQISIITPLCNRLDLTRACLDSLRRTLRRWDYEWILIDDGSTDGTREFLGTLADEDRRVRVVVNDAPRGFAANNNHGARLARAPLLCLLNNDTVLLPGWLEPMARAARLPDVACVGNVQREPVSGLLDHAGVYFNADGYAQHAGKDEPVAPREDYLEWPAVTAACWVVRKTVFLGLGGFDEAFHNGAEDADFCLRARTRGYRHFVANRSVIYHHISASPGRKQVEERNLNLFRERWLAYLQTDGSLRRTVARERLAGRSYLRKHAWQPWRFNAWRLLRAAGQMLALHPPGRLLDPAPRLLFRAADFLRQRWRVNMAGPRPTARAGAPVFVMMGDTALTSRRAGVPTAVRSLAGAFGRMGAPVQPVRWNPATRSLALLPRDLSLGLDFERLRAPLAALSRAHSAGSITNPSLADWQAPVLDTPSLHELPPGAVPPGAWIVLPEVLEPGRAEPLLEYVHRHGWRLAVVLYDAMATNEPGLFPLGTPHAAEVFLRTISGADLVLPVSYYTAEDWRLFTESKGLPSPPVKVCVPGADTCARQRGTRGPRRPAAAPVRILCVSAVTPHKNHRALLAAFDLAVAARPDLNLELTLVGAPRLFNDDNAPEAVLLCVERHPGRVRWVEWVEYSTLRKLYEECDFTVFPSRLEGWGLPIVESLWFGRPCICANFGAMAETATGGGCLTVDVRDPQALADAILLLAGSPERLAAFAAEIEARPLRRWEDYAHELLGTLWTI